MKTLLNITLIAACVFVSGAPAFGEEYADRGHELLLRGNYQQAVGYLTAAVKLNPTDLEIRRQLCSAYVGAGMSREAIQQLRVIATVTAPTAEDFNLQAEAYSQLGDSKTAILRFKQALMVEPSNGPARIGLAKILLFAGDYASARAACNDTLRTSRDPVVRKQAIDLLGALKDREKGHITEKA